MDNETLAKLAGIMLIWVLVSFALGFVIARVAMWWKRWNSDEYGAELLSKAREDKAQ
jgi:hypothetical protein